MDRENTGKDRFRDGDSLLVVGHLKQSQGFIFRLDKISILRVQSLCTRYLKRRDEWDKGNVLSVDKFWFFFWKHRMTSTLFLESTESC